MCSHKVRDIHSDIAAGREVEPGRLPEAEAHASACPGCAAALRADRALLARIAEAPEPLSQAFVRATCARAIGAKGTGPLWWVSLPLSWRLGFAALLIAAAAGGYLAGRPPGRGAAGSPAGLVSLPDSPEVLAMRLGSPCAQPGGEP